MDSIERGLDGQERMRPATPAEVAAEDARRQRAAISELSGLRTYRTRHFQPEPTDEETVTMVADALRTLTVQEQAGTTTIWAHADDELVVWIIPFGT